MTAPIASPLESTVEKHIGSTSRLVRQVDIAFSLLIVISLTLGVLFLAVIADHWLLKEGLSMSLRFGIFAVLLSVVGLYIYWKIVPFFLYSINPVYTADLIEQEVPTFKNSLINWLLIRQEREERPDMPNDKINDQMYKGIVRTAAVNVQTAPAGHVVDLRKLILVGTFFAMLLIVFIGYAAFSPKSLFTSLGRIMLPFSGIERPQAAQFRNVKPGDITALQGETLTISAEVVSQSEEPVYLVFSTDDGQAVRQRMRMVQPEGKIAFETETPFPPGKQGFERGFHSSVDYRIVQGESQSKQYRIDVQPAASVEIVSLHYDFPDYTGLPREIIEHGGDIRVLEGTTVTVAVRSTLPLQKIDLVFDDNPASNVPMQLADAQKTEAKGTFTLKTPFSHKTFSFRATDENGNASRRSGIYRIDVIPDQPPKVQWADTAANLREVAQMDVPFNETLQLPIQAEDPDFALRYLRFKAESPGKRIPDVPLLNSPTSGPTKHRGQIKKTVPFSPEEKRLAGGDTVEIWAEAIDTKLPEANVSSTRRIKIHVIDPQAKEEKEQQQDKNDGNGEPQQDDSQEKGGDNTDKKDPNKEGTEGEQGNDENTGKQDAGEQQNPNEGEQNPNDQKQPENNQNKEEEKKQDQNPNGKSEQNDQQGGEGKQEGSEKGDSNQGAAGDEPGEGGERGPGDQPDNGQKGENSPADQPVEEKQKGEGAGGEKTGSKKQEQDAGVNPETQDGDAMERIVEQMKEEGLFPGANPFLRNDNKNLRSDSLDPNSPNQSKQGNDPTNPKQSDRSPKGNEQNQPQNQPDKPKEGEQEQRPQHDGTNSGQAGNKDTQSGDQQGKSQEEQDKGSSGSQGEQDNSDGNQQKGQKGGEGSADQQQQGNEPQDGDPGNRGLPGGTGGGDNTTKETAPDDPNLKYANEVTNMVLDYLANQLRDKPNDGLLNRLGWSEDQLRQFYDKWRKMSENGKQPGGDEKNGLEEAWKSWGLLRPQNRPAVQGSQTRKQDSKGVTEAQRPPVPPAIRNRFQMYNDNVGK